MVVTYCDEEKGEWYMLMLAELRKTLSDDYKVYLDIALQGKKGPSAKDLRMMSFMKNLYGE